jgi:hypothetical protein
MSKSEVYSWRLDPDLKRRLEAAASEEKTSIGALLDRIARDWLGRRVSEEDEEALQRRLHAKAAEVIGTIRLGRGPYTRERIRETVKANLSERRRRRGPSESD